MITDPEGAETAALTAAVDLCGKRVLEIGSGDGRLTWRYAEATAQVLGIDTDEERVAAARAATPSSLGDRVRFEVADVAGLAGPRSSFDVAVLAWSL
jgi:2-polyprenyl-3-methyl-5-hydroxy-6-metoxy-1,4-benzoquinol methylase